MARDADTSVDGLLLVDKPQGWTSHDVVARCRRLLGTRKVGHSGTLDPMATGLLVLAAGKATRLLTYVTGHDKSYDATIRLGESTVTDDAEGEVTASADASGLTDAAIRAAVVELVGDILQRPTAVSAIKVDGQRAYARVRAGEDVVLQARPVTVARFDVHEVRRTGTVVDVDVTVDVSSGTYVRALARDLGEALDVGGHLTALRRTRVGALSVDAAHDMAALAAQVEEGAGIDLTPLDAAAKVASTSRLWTQPPRRCCRRSRSPRLRHAPLDSAKCCPAAVANWGAPPRVTITPRTLSPSTHSARRSRWCGQPAQMCAPSSSSSRRLPQREEAAQWWGTMTR